MGDHDAMGEDLETRDRPHSEIEMLDSFDWFLNDENEEDDQKEGDILAWADACLEKEPITVAERERLGNNAMSPAECRTLCEVDATSVQQVVLRTKAQVLKRKRKREAYGAAADDMEITREDGGRASASAKSDDAQVAHAYRRLASLQKSRLLDGNMRTSSEDSEKEEVQQEQQEQQEQQQQERQQQEEEEPRDGGGREQKHGYKIDMVQELCRGNVSGVAAALAEKYGSSSQLSASLQECMEYLHAASAWANRLPPGGTCPRQAGTKGVPAVGSDLVRGPHKSGATTRHMARGESPVEASLQAPVHGGQLDRPRDLTPVPTQAPKPPARAPRTPSPVAWVLCLPCISAEAAAPEGAAQGSGHHTNGGRAVRHVSPPARAVTGGQLEEESEGSRSLPEDDDNGGGGQAGKSLKRGHDRDRCRMSEENNPQVGAGAGVGAGARDEPGARARAGGRMLKRATVRKDASSTAQLKAHHAAAAAAAAAAACVCCR